MGLLSGTPLTAGIPGIPLQPLYNPDLFSVLLPSVQVLAGLLYPAQLCYNIQQPLMAVNIPLVGYGWIKMHNMMHHRWEVMIGTVWAVGAGTQPSWYEQPCFWIKPSIPP